MKIKNFLFSYGMVSTLILGISGNNIYAEEVEKPYNRTNTIIKSEQHTHPHINEKILLAQTVNFIGENSTSFRFNESGNLNFFIGNIGNSKLDFSVKGPNNELVIGGYVKPGDQKTIATIIQTALSPLPKGTYSISISNDSKEKGAFQIIVEHSE